MVNLKEIDLSRTKSDDGRTTHPDIEDKRPYLALLNEGWKVVQFRNKDNGLSASDGIREIKLSSENVKRLIRLP